jgi:hypothetical protein
MKAIIETLEIFLKGLITWCQAAAAPAQSVQAILSITDSETRTGRLIALWLWSAILTMLFQTPIFRMYRIEWTDMGFLVPYVLMMSLNVLLIGAIVHLGFRLFRLSSNLFDTLAMFVATVGVYWPISSFLAIPAQANLLSIMSTIKALNLSFWDAITRLFHEASKGGPFGEIMLVVEPLGFVFSLCSFAIFAECIVQQYGGSRFRTLLAIQFSSTLAIFIVLPISQLVNLLIWAALK